MEIYVVRHTHVAVPSGVCYGRAEVPLAETFEAEAGETVRRLPDGIESVFTSPAERCRRLAEKISAKYFVSDSLQEMNFGEWEKCRWDDLPRSEVDAWCENFVDVAPPGGENLRQMYSRVSAFMDSLEKSNYQRVLIVTHAGVIRCINARKNNLELKDLFSFNAEYGKMYIF